MFNFIILRFLDHVLLTVLVIIETTAEWICQMRMIFIFVVSVKQSGDSLFECVMSFYRHVHFQSFLSNIIGYSLQQGFFQACDNLFFLYLLMLLLLPFFQSSIKQFSNPNNFILGVFEPSKGIVLFNDFFKIVTILKVSWYTSTFKFGRVTKPILFIKFFHNRLIANFYV